MSEERREEWNSPTVRRLLAANRMLTKKVAELEDAAIELHRIKTAPENNAAGIFLALSTAREIIEQPESYYEGGDGVGVAINKYGERCSPTAHDAAAWTMVGALSIVIGSSLDLFNATMDVIRRADPSLTNRHGRPRTHEEALAALGCAMQHVALMKLTEIDVEVSNVFHLDPAS